jgi:hypothetical protein
MDPARARLHLQLTVSPSKTQVFSGDQMKVPAKEKVVSYHR